LQVSLSGERSLLEGIYRMHFGVPEAATHGMGYAEVFVDARL
jgi:hypothetical protein